MASGDDGGRLAQDELAGNTIRSDRVDASLNPDSSKAVRPASDKQTECPPCSKALATEDVPGRSSSADGDAKASTCPICLAEYTDDVVTLEKCGHQFCTGCITRALRDGYRCPVCQTACKDPRGNQPEGSMKVEIESYFHLPGYPDDGVITIRYIMPSGTQTVDHPKPGEPFSGVTRTAYLPDNQEGREVLRLLRKAFDARLVFTVGRSVTSGIDDIVTWNDIHHKTSPTGGPTHYGYPDAEYLSRVKEDLAAKGIV